MSFQIELSPEQKTHSLLVEDLFEALQKTFAEEVERRGLTQAEMAKEIGVDISTINKWMNLKGNPTLKTISKLYCAMKRQGWSNLIVPESLNNIFINIEANSGRVGLDERIVTNELLTNSRTNIVQEINREPCNV
ncbi:helix-turn-helix domain-containing protein [Gluconobacter sp. Dm-44]|uniref:helix-turn-helix domain-containing protein n=1 Tax=Gluconobacter sp. Dm-44 TaxID=2799805 RepID=UPI001B8CDDC6|nr:helix-turn-helix domain-containing protein [Gluconobacter sp. Dm-44]MBS1060738.1 helix-turn-helix domain-containing protein [Gluconobacter sp. Dm-44]